MLAQADAVGGIDDDREMRLGFKHGDGVEIERVAGVGLEGTDAAFAEQDVKVSFAQDVFRAHQQILDGRAHATLEHDGKFAAPDFFQERKILHIPRADLEAVRVFLDHFEVLRVHDLGDDRQARDLARFGKELQPFDAQSLKTVGRSAWLERTAAQDFRAAFFDRLRDPRDLLARLHGARTAHHDDFVPTHFHPADFHRARVATAKFASHKLVRLQHGRRTFHSGNRRDGFFANLILGPDDANDRPNRAAADFRLQSPLLDTIENVLDLLLSCAGFCNDNHDKGGEVSGEGW